MLVTAGLQTTAHDGTHDMPHIQLRMLPSELDVLILDWLVAIRMQQHLMAPPVAALDCTTT